jgi:hypothetical protein
MKLAEKFAMLSLWDALIDGDIAAFDQILASLKSGLDVIGGTEKARSALGRALLPSKNVAQLKAS